MQGDNKRKVVDRIKREQALPGLRLKQVLNLYY
jgi:hypothetical protein